MKLNLYKCSKGDHEWYSLAKEICKGAIPLYCQGLLGMSFISIPEKIEFFKEVEIDLTSFLDEETKKTNEENQTLKAELAQKTEELEEYKHIGLRMYFK